MNDAAKSLLIGLVMSGVGWTGFYGLMRLMPRRWPIPAGVLLAVAAIAGLQDVFGAADGWTVMHHLLGGAVLFGAFFIATDPVTSPLTPKGKFVFGLGVGLFIMILRLYSGYPEGVMFAVLLMNGLTPLINRWTIPAPFGAVKKSKKASKKG